MFDEVLEEELEDEEDKDAFDEFEDEDNDEESDESEDEDDNEGSDEEESEDAEEVDRQVAIQNGKILLYLFILNKLIIKKNNHQELEGKFLKW